MNAHDLFSLLDIALIYQTSEFSILNEERSPRKTVLLKELTASPDGIFLHELHVFICWLIEDIEKEIYISRQCSLRFFHMHGDIEMLKVCIYT